MRKSLWLLAAGITALTLNACSTDVDTDGCAQGQVKCVNGQVFSCKSDNQWPALGVNCESGICLDTKQCKASPCVPGEKKCEGAVFSECQRNGETWEKVVCGSNINLGAFCHVDLVCVACNLDPDCKAADKHCVDHVCQPLTVKACVDGQTKCEAKKVYTCRQKAWENELNCPNGCNAANTDCAPAVGVCTNGEKKCQGGFLFTCVSEAWNVGAPCPTGEQCLDGAFTCTRINVCTPSAKACIAGGYNECNSAGTQLTTSACGSLGYETKPYCDDAKGCIECRNGDDCKVLGKPVCNENTKTCQAATAVCAPGEQMCSGNTLKKCNTAQSGFDSTVCSASTPYCDDAKGCIECRNGDDCKVAAKPVCNVETKTCQAAALVCTPGQQMCAGNTLKKCNTEQSGFDSTVCVSTKPYCDEAKGCIECRNGEDCKVAAKPVCNVDTKTCQAAPIICAVGEQMCAGNTLKKCNTAQSGFDSIVCVSSKPYCDDAKGCIECRNGDDCKVAGKSVCNVDTKVCQAPTPVCTGSEKKCEGEVFSQCVSGQWSTQNCVLSSQVCDKISGCVTPSVGKSYTHHFEACIFGSGYSTGECTQADTPKLTFLLGILPSGTEPITGNSLKLNKAGSAKVTVTNGVGELSVVVKKVNTSDADVSIKVNGVEVIGKKGMITDEQVTLVNKSVNVSGTVDIVINTTERIVIDDLKWTDYKL